jgi:peptidoglycan/LPS O-acetylase OafA/YrhL
MLRAMTTAQAPSTRAADQALSREQLVFLDGIRGLAAVAVALYHTFLFTGHSGDAARDLPVLPRLFFLGQYGVAVFIVLSGFVLAWQSQSAAGVRLKGGLAEFMRRRSRRILPPYYAVLAIFSVLILAIPALNTLSGTDWDSKLPVNAHAVITHALLVNNLGDDAVRIDGPLWSVATEFQIYIVFALALIPLWRRFGVFAAALAGLAAGLALHAAFGLDAARPWYIGLFGFGMCAAEIVYTQRLVLSVRQWRLVAATLVGVVVLAALARQATVAQRPWLFEPILGAGVAAMLVAISRNVSGLAYRTLAGRHLLTLGLFSYSIYLVHSPIIGWFNLATVGIHMPTIVRLGMLILVALPIAVGLAYAFHVLVERRFLTTHQRTLEAR